MTGQPNRKETAKQRRARHTAPSEAIPASTSQRRLASASQTTTPDAADRIARHPLQKQTDAQQSRAAVRVSRERTRRLVGGPSPHQK